MDSPSRARLIEERRFEEAAELQAAALELRPGDAELHHQMAWLLGGLERFDQAAAAERTALVLHPEEPRYAQALAKYLARDGDVEGARRADYQAELLETARREDFEEQQARAKAAMREAIVAVVTACERSPHFRAIRSFDRTSRLLHHHTLDSVPGWDRFLALRHRAGEVARLTGLGSFKVQDPGQLIDKRLARGMAWELPVAGLLAELAARCDRRATFVEVGANVGVHTVCAAREHEGTVLAFEPVRATYHRLLSNLALNRITNVLALDRACSDSPGRGRMARTTGYDPGLARLERGRGGAVTITTVDAEVRRIGSAVALLKVDVEGHEAEVLEGARHTLERARPVVVCELLSGVSERVVPRLEAMGYKPIHLFRSDWVFVPLERALRPSTADAT